MRFLSFQLDKEAIDRAARAGAYKEIEKQLKDILEYVLMGNRRNR